MVRIHREPPGEGPPGGAVAYIHFGAESACQCQTKDLQRTDSYFEELQVIENAVK